MSRPAHRLAAKARTSDVHVSEDVTFAGLLLSEPLLLGLKRAGFERPSPIQLRAIPLGRCAVDLIVQAKSGTGKTCVLAVLALEVLVSAPPSGRCRALVLAPTREVAVQVAQVIAAIGAEVPGLAVHTLIGGLPLAQDVANLRRCNIAVGTPGRVRQLVDSEALNTDSVRLFVMDEADKLMEDAFVDDINFIYSTLPASKQMVALSATYPETLANLLARYMRSPTFVRLGKSSAALLGIRQYVLTVPHEPLVTKQLKLKLDALVNILSTVSFTQCLVFSNHQTRAETLCSQLSGRGWPSAHLSSSLCQERRLEALEQLTSLRCRVLVTTDLGARGVDSEHADLVVQLDVPWDGATYLHRVGRAGRYGSLGAAIALVSVGDEERRLTTVLAAAGVSPLRLPDPPPADLKTGPTDGWPPFVTAHNGREENGGHAAEGEEEEEWCGGAGRTPGRGAESGGRGAGRSNGHAAAAAVNGDASRGGGDAGGQGGRKIRVARRRGAAGPAAAEQRQDSALLEAATDGWARAVATRGRREPAAPAPAAGVPSPPALDSDRPSAGGLGSSRTEETAAAAEADSDSDGSQDSFKALLKAYKRDQERQISRFSAGGEKAPTSGGGKTQAPASAGREGTTPASGGPKAQQKAGVAAGECDARNGSEPGDSVPVAAVKDVAAEGSNVALKPDCDGDQKSDGDSDAEAGSVDNDRLRRVLTKLNPKQVQSLTEDDLRTLVVYLKVRRGANCRMYRQAVNLVRSKGVYQVLLQSRCAADIETSLTSLMEKLSVKPVLRAARSTATSAVDVASSAVDSGEVGGEPTRKTEVRTRSSVNTRVTKSFEGDVGSVRSSLGNGEAGVRNSDAGVTAPVPAVSVNGTFPSPRSAGLAGASAAPYTFPSMNGAATCTTSAAIHTTTNYDEEVRQIPSRAEDVEAFQRSLRLKESRLRAARARAATVDSSSSEDSSDESTSEEATLSMRGGRSSGRQRRAVHPRPSTGLGVQYSDAEIINRPPVLDATVPGESHAQRSGGAIPRRGTPGSGAGHPTHPHGYPDQMGVPSWSQGFPVYPGWSHGSYHHMRPSAWSGYDGGAYSSQPGTYGCGPAWSASHGGSCGQSYGRPDRHPTQHAPRSWDELLHTCYNQQTQYLAHMSRFYANNYGQ